jgi:hypothetical protein
MVASNELSPRCSPPPVSFRPPCALKLFDELELKFLLLTPLWNLLLNELVLVLAK